LGRTVHPAEENGPPAPSFRSSSSFEVVVVVPSSSSSLSSSSSSRVSSVVSYVSTVLSYVPMLALASNVPPERRLLLLLRPLSSTLYSSRTSDTTVCDWPSSSFSRAPSSTSSSPRLSSFRPLNSSSG